ncbi:protein disulfide isomerase [Phanerochaete sordida]|uniref:protein disulfide-isomerase n=1 Tax=Phanerochaete sordida TaxID=48140 RepID=A0A9P3FZC2_9APHY|nr:protein disulfide isomerase [Phanerochaete sordida]
MKLSFTLFTALAALGGAWASNVIDLTPDNFDQVVGKGKPALVEFFAPWCGHCKNLAPKYEELADVFAHAKDKVVIAKVDADGEGKPLGQKYGVTGFPTLKWFPADGGEPEAYNGGREVLDLATFITEKSGVKSKIRPPPPPAFEVLDSHTFDDVALDPTKDVLVTFTAPWCGHCKRLKPTYEQVATDFKNEPNCVVANVDADAAANKPLAQKYGVGSFPTIKFFPKGNKDAPVDYEGGRTEEDFVAFLNEHCGTHRAAGGLLDESAGRHPEFDSLASRFATAAADVRNKLVEDASLLASAFGPQFKYYVRVMEKVVNGSEEYIEKEAKRLQSILTKRSVSPQKLDEVKIKANILATFKAVEEKVEEVVEELQEKVDEAVGRDTAEL